MRCSRCGSEKVCRKIVVTGIFKDGYLEKVDTEEWENADGFLRWCDGCGLLFDDEDDDVDG